MIQLLHGDCLELMHDIPDKSIDMIQSSLFMTTMPAELFGVTVKDGVFGRVVSMDESRKP